MIKSGELVHELEALRYTAAVSALESVPDAALVGVSASVRVLVGASASVVGDGDLSFDGGRRSRRAGAAAVQFLQCCGS